MKILRSLEDLQEEGSFIASGRVNAVKEEYTSIVIKDGLTVHVGSPLPVEAGDYISVQVRGTPKIIWETSRTILVYEDFDIVKDLSRVLKAFRKHAPSLGSLLSRISDPILLCILKQILPEEVDSKCPVWERGHSLRVRFHTVPSALTYHHAYIGGNYIHSLGVAQTSWHLGKLKGIEGLPLEILIAGGLLHDIGKLMAFTPIKKGEILTVRPTTIRVKEHIEIGISIIEKIEEFLSPHIDDRDKLHILIDAISGIIATHHGLKSWGAIREPESIIEQIIFVADYLESRTGTYNPLHPHDTDSLILKLLSL